VTTYTVGSGDTLYAKYQTTTNSIFTSWGINGVDSTDNPISFDATEDKEIKPVYITTVAEAGIAYVSPNGYASDTANGSKGLPFSNIQDAINSLTSGTVRISTGNYATDATLTMKPGVSLVGNYTVSTDGKDWTAATYSKSEQGSEVDPQSIITCNAIAAGTSNAYFSVISMSGSSFTNATQINGLTIEYDTLSRDCIAGILISDNASPLIQNCKITSGTATSYSQGIRNIDSASTITNCSITSGAAKYSDGIYNESGSMKISYSSVETSTALSGTQGIYNSSAKDVVISHCCIISTGLNSDGFYGFSMGIVNSSSTTTIQNNAILASAGGPLSMFGISLGTRAISENASTSIITENTIISKPNGFGGSGSVYWSSQSSSLIANNIISMPTSFMNQYGLYFSSSNCIVAGNVINMGKSTSGGSMYGIYSTGSNYPLLINNTIAGGSCKSSSENEYDIYVASGSPILINNGLFSKESTYESYGVYFDSSSIKPQKLLNNAYFDFTTALYAPRSTTSVYYVLSPSQFTTSRTGLDTEDMSGNVGGTIGVSDDTWDPSTIFTDYTNDDFTLSPSANSSITTGGFVLDSAKLDSYMASTGADFSFTGEQIMDILSKDMNGTPRGSSWSIGAYAAK
jgi:hypothetical protein